MKIVCLPPESLSSDPSIKAAVEFALSDHNSKHPFSLIDLLSVDSAAFQDLGGSTVYYLNLNLKLRHEPEPNWKKPPPFAVAVACLPPTMTPSLSTGFVHLQEYEMNSPDEDSDEITSRMIHKITPMFNKLSTRRESDNTAAILSIEHHNQKTNPQNVLHLNELVDCVHFQSDDKFINPMEEYQLTLDVSDYYSCSLVTTFATRSKLWPDSEAFDCTPLVKLLDKPYPEWISLDLIRHVAAFGLQHRFLLSSPHQSPFFKNIVCINNLSYFAHQLGPHQTTHGLLRFLGQDNALVDPEVLILMVDKLTSLIPCLGGREHTHLLLPVLISICSDAPYVLRTAIRPFHKISLHTTHSAFSTFFIPFLSRLACSKFPPRRASSCAYFRLAYLHATTIEVKHKLLKMYTSLATDRFPSVRGAAACSLADFAAVVRPDTLDVFGILGIVEPDELFMRLLGDANDYVKILALKECTSFWKLGTEKNLIINALFAVSQDSCMDVRIVIPSILYEFCVALGLEYVSSSLVLICRIVMNLFCGSPTLLREEVAKGLIRLFRFLGPEVQLLFLPILKRMYFDSSLYVSAASAWLLMHMLSVRREGLSHDVISVLNDLVVGGSVYAKLNIIIKLDYVWERLDQNSCELVRDTVKELAGNSSDMIVLLVVVCSPMLARFLGIKMFMELCRERLKDKNVLLRKAAKKSLYFLETQVPHDEELGIVQDLCFPQDLSQLIHFIHGGFKKAVKG